MILSIVVPTKNRASRIRGLLDNLSAAADGARITACVVDDASDGDSRERLRAVSREYEGIDWVFLDASVGAPTARNVGADRTKSEWVWFLDDDDIPEASTILEVAKRISELESNSEELVLLCAEICRGGVPLRTVRPSGDRLFQAYSARGHQVNTSCSIFRRRLFDAIGGWDERLVAGQDADIFLRASVRTDAVVFDDLCVRVDHGGSDRMTSDAGRQFRGKVQFLTKNFRLLRWNRRLRYAASILSFHPYWRRRSK